MLLQKCRQLVLIHILITGLPLRSVAESPQLLQSPFTAERAEDAQHDWAKALENDEVLVNKIGMKLKLIPPGEFSMGSTEEELNRCLAMHPDCAPFMQNFLRYEVPQHRVRITQPFYLGIYEVKQAEFQEVMGHNPSRNSVTGNGNVDLKGVDTNQSPVDSVTWYDAAEFCNKLSAREGLTPFYTFTDEVRHDGHLVKATCKVAAGERFPCYRLPTEAEWEYACRAGTITNFSCGDTINADDANLSGEPFGKGKAQNKIFRPTNVGEYKPNAFGIFDMHGNISELCGDTFGLEVYRSSKEMNEDPFFEQSDPVPHSIRGASWMHSAPLARSARRAVNMPSIVTGFRTVFVLGVKS